MHTTPIVPLLFFLRLTAQATSYFRTTEDKMKIDFKLEKPPTPIPGTYIDKYFKNIFIPHYHEQFELLVDKLVDALNEVLNESRR